MARPKNQDGRRRQLVAATAAAVGERGLSGLRLKDIADVVYDANYYYCTVEPMLFQQRCGPGDSAQGDSNGGCHFAVTSFRLSDYTPLVGDSCQGTNTPGASIPPQARTNYASAQAKMQLDPNQAPLLIRPTGKAAHPRKIFDVNGPEAQIIKDWATKFSTQ